MDKLSLDDEIDRFKAQRAYYSPTMSVALNLIDKLKRENERLREQLALSHNGTLQPQGGINQPNPYKHSVNSDPNNQANWSDERFAYEVKQQQERLAQQPKTRADDV
jgi:hypothetical protein